MAIAMAGATEALQYIARISFTIYHTAHNAAQTRGTDLNIFISIMGFSPSFCIVFSTKPGLGPALLEASFPAPSSEAPFSSRGNVGAFRRTSSGESVSGDWDVGETSWVFWVCSLPSVSSTVGGKWLAIASIKPGFKVPAQWSRELDAKGKRPPVRKSRN